MGTFLPILVTRLLEADSLSVPDIKDGASANHNGGCLFPYRTIRATFYRDRWAEDGRWTQVESQLDVRADNPAGTSALSFVTGIIDACESGWHI